MNFIKLLPPVTLLFAAHSNNNMYKDIFFPTQLNEIEKMIVYHKIQKIGKEMVLKMMKETINNPYTQDASTHLPTQLKVRKNKTDYFASFIIDTIEEQEKEFGYVPQQTSKKIKGIWHVSLPTNYLGNYTRYWHKKDFKGEYIELHALFTDTPALLEVIYNYY
ncbi:MAG TPA: hypothetical protein VHX42_03190 [Candidatus Babeliales bacterium]|nr:hypothetical protein [Candidatus Babeliales bacterium]